MEDLIYNIVIPVVMGFIGYFLKRTMNDIDSVKKNFVSRSEYEEDMKSVTGDIKEIKRDFLMREDFFREINKIDRKLDTINDILMNWKNRG